MRKLVLLAVVVFVLLASGCESTKNSFATISMGTADDPVFLQVLSEHDVRLKYGATFMDDPFVSATGTLLPTYNDYIVLKLNFNNPTKVPFMLLRAEVSDERGKIFATYMTREKFTSFAMDQSPDQANNTVKRNKIEWYYLPNPIMTIDSGRQSYLLILVGKHPIPDTATIHVAVSVGNQAKSFDIPVPISND